MDHPTATPVPREVLNHTTKAMDPRFGSSHDDIVSFNTQCSSQWDGLRRDVSQIMLIEGHWAHQSTKLYYNGLPHAQITEKDAPVQLGIERIPH
jgi:hypothetical protein